MQAIDLTDSSTVQEEITGIAQRSDGKNVFIETYQRGNDTPSINYVYIDSNFLISCDSLDTIHDSIGNPEVENPFGEQIIATSKPFENQSWFQIKNDSLGLFRKTQYVGTILTSVGSFSNVYGFPLLDSSKAKSPFMTPCYANNIGWVGSYRSDKFNNSDSLWFNPVFIQLGNIVRGKMIPKRGYNNSMPKKMMFSNLINGVIFWDEGLRQ
jgi:hypothetical protein